VLSVVVDCSYQDPPPFHVTVNTQIRLTSKEQVKQDIFQRSFCLAQICSLEVLYCAQGPG